MMYSLGRQVLPVDTHVGRLAVRFGLIPAGLGPVAIHAALDELVPAADRYAFHVNGVAHGRAVCRARRPRCTDCVVAKLCGSASNRSGGKVSQTSAESGSRACTPTTPAEPISLRSVPKVVDH